LANDVQFAPNKEKMHVYISENFLLIIENPLHRMVEGVLDFSLTGILASLANPLAENKISIFAISTFNTDYLLIKSHSIEKAKVVLENEGHTFSDI